METAMEQERTPAELAAEYAALDKERLTLAVRIDAIEVQQRALKQAIRNHIPEGVDTLVLTATTGARLRVTPTEQELFSPAVGKADTFWQWVELNGRFDLMQRRVSVTAIADYAKKHGQYPPFIDRFVKNDARITVTQPAV